MPAPLVLSVIIMAIMALHDVGGVFRTCHMVSVRIIRDCEYENSLETAMQITVGLFCVFPSSSRGQSRRASRTQALPPASPSNLDCAINSCEAEQGIQPLHFGFLICKMGIIISHI